MSAGVVLRADSRADRDSGNRLGIAVRVGLGWEMPFDVSLFVAPGTPVPWDILADGLEMVQAWDLAAPFTREKALACDIGSDADRAATLPVVGDLRIPVYSPDLVFARRIDASRRLLQSWADDAAGDPRLSFLRALHRVKPRFCVLPRLWLATAEERARVTNCGLDATGSIPGSKGRRFGRRH